MSAHVLTAYGTTDCPVQQVRAFADDESDALVCSACGAEVDYAPPTVEDLEREDDVDDYDLRGAR